MERDPYAQFFANWSASFHENYPIPPPETDESELTGWELTIKELTNFSLQTEKQSTPSTSTFGIKIYISVFNTSAGQFHGKTWTSPLITETNSFFINLTTYGILCGKDSLVVIEFSFCVQYLNNETAERSLFFTVIPFPNVSIERELPLYNGTPRILMAFPKSFSNTLTNRQGTLSIEFKKYDDLVKASVFMPLCTFLNKPVPGIKAYMPLDLEETMPLTITRLCLSPPANFEEQLHEQIKTMFGQQYQVQSSKIQLRIVKYSVQIAVHNTHKFILDTLQAEINVENGWVFDGQIVLPQFVQTDSRFAVCLQILITIEIDLSFIKSTSFFGPSPSKEKQIFDVPIGFTIVPISNDRLVEVMPSIMTRHSPFGVRILTPNVGIPGISFNAFFNPTISKPIDQPQEFPFDFKPLLAADGGALLPLDLKESPEIPILKSEFTDPLNVNHILFLFKFISPRPSLLKRFPLDLFKFVYIEMDLWKYGKVRSKKCSCQLLQECLIFHENESKKDDKGALLTIEYDLRTYEEVVNYFLLMRANELQAYIIDAETNIQIGSFNIPSAALLRQKRTSLQFSLYSKMMANDGELLGNVYFTCGSYGSSTAKIRRSEFQNHHYDSNAIQIAKPLIDTDEEYRMSVKTSVLPHFELAARVRNGKRKKVVLNELQKRFLRTLVLYPVPGLESRFVFVSAYDAEVKTKIYCHSNDERLRFIRKLRPEESVLDYEKVYLFDRNETADFNQNPNVPLSERFNLNTAKDESFIAKPEEEIHLLFGFFFATEFVDTEISVTLTDDRENLLDCFTVKLKNTGSVIHESVNLVTHENGTVSTTLHSIHNITAACATSALVTAHPSDFGTRISTKNLATNLKCLVLCFGKDNSLIKIVRLNILVVKLVESLKINNKLKLELPQFIGNKICCKSDDSRIAKFQTYNAPSILESPGEVMIKSLAPGNARLIVYNETKKVAGVTLLLTVSDVKDDYEEQQSLGKCEMKATIGKTLKRTLPYKNQTDRMKSIRLTTTHPNYIQFDPTHYDIDPHKSAKLRFILLPRKKEEYAVIHVFLQESGVPRSQCEYFTLQVTYTSGNADKKKDDADE